MTCWGRLFVSVCDSATEVLIPARFCYKFEHVRRGVGMYRFSRLRVPCSIAVAGLAVALLSAQPALAANVTGSGTLIVERPTLISAGYEWRITGDDNRNAKVEVTYRKKGETAWHSAIAPM